VRAKFLNQEQNTMTLVTIFKPEPLSYLESASVWNNRHTVCGLSLYLYTSVLSQMLLIGYATHYLFCDR